MQTPDHGDLIAAARVLRGHRAARRPWVLARLLAEAEAAEDHRRAGLGSHPRWGDGSLMAAALRRPGVLLRGPDDPDYLACLALVAGYLATVTGAGTMRLGTEALPPVWSRQLEARHGDHADDTHDRGSGLDADP